MINNLDDIKKKFGKKIIINASLAKYSWFNLGGPAELLFKPENIIDIQEFFKITHKNLYPLTIMGAGSNTLIRDAGVGGITIKLSPKFSYVNKLSENKIEVGAATLDRTVSNFASDNGLSGFEFLSCIPGTIGGGIRMNSGCFNREFKDILISVQAINRSGEIFTIPAKEINFDYRSCNLSKDLVFLSASFQGTKKQKEKIKEEMIILKEKKEKSQPTRIKTGGSTFKNPIKQTNKKVWEIIKESVPGEISFGDATISEKHCNFFINKDKASCSDMKKLINFVQKKVFDTTGIRLSLEIILVE